MRGDTVAEYVVAAVCSGMKVGVIQAYVGESDNTARKLDVYISLWIR